LQKNPVIQLDEIVIIATSSAASALDKSSIADSRSVPAAAAFRAHLDDKAVTLSLSDDGMLIDAESKSEWSPLGQAISGPNKGRRLEQVDHGVHFAFAWLAFDPWLQ